MTERGLKGSSDTRYSGKYMRKIGYRSDGIQGNPSDGGTPSDGLPSTPSTNEKLSHHKIGCFVI